MTSVAGLTSFVDGQRSMKRRNFYSQSPIISQMRNALLVLVITLAAVGVSRPAHADDKETARREYMEGTRRYDLNEFAPALEAFKRAYLAYEDPAFLYNIAQCYRQLGDKPSAVKFYRSYLRKVPDAPNRDEVTSTIASLDAAIAADRAKAEAAAAAQRAHSEPSASPAVSSQTLTAAPAAKPTPVYKKWWLWTIVGVAAAGAAAGVAVAVTSQRTENSFMPVTVNR